MKKNLLFILVMLSGLMIASVSQAQNKFGHINFAQLYSMMPGMDSVQIKFEEYNKGIQEAYDAMQAELQTKYVNYQEQLEKGMSDIVRQTKEAELADLQQRIQTFEITASEELQNKELELTTPIIEEAKKAVEEVAKENGYTYIFNSTEGLLLYAEPSDDIMELVKAKLNISEE